MSHRQEQILYALQQNMTYGLDLFQLSYDLEGAPEASIRRDIQSLRRQGYNISFASPNGVYRLGK